MNLFAIPPFLTGCILGTIGFLVYLKNKKSKVNLIFMLFCLSMVWWLFMYSIMYLSNSPIVALKWARIGFVGIIFIPIFAFHFILTFLGEKRPKLLLVVYLLGISSLILSRTNLIYGGIEKHFWGYYPTAGKFYIIFLIAFIVLFLLGISNLFIKLRHSSKLEIKREQIIYVIVAFGIGTIGIVDYLVKYPSIQIYPFGYICALIFISIIAYAIVRHQLLDIKVIVKKTLVFAGLFIASYGVFASFAYLGSTLFVNMVHNSWVAMLPSMIIVVLMLRPLESFLRTSTDKFLFQQKYDYKTLLKTFTNEVLTVLDLNDLVKTTVSKLCDILRLENAAIILRDGDNCRIAASIGINEEEYDVDMGECILEYFRVGKPYILVTDSHDERSLEHDVKIAVSSLKGSFVIPFMHHNVLLGMLMLGEKKSDEDFTQDDIDILLPLARTLSIAIANAQLFEKLSESQAQAAQREKMAVIGTLSAGINHEICNPLGIARGQCEMFLLNLKEGLYKEKTDAELLEKAADIMDKVIHETDRATLITRKLSSFAKPAKGYAEEDVRVETELNEVVSLVEHDLSLDNINIVKHIAEDIPAINADKKQLQEIFFNVVRNAAQSINSDGTITLRAFYSDNKVVVQVQDTGEGISKENLNKIFAPFFTTKDPGKGTGLGLFIVKQIVAKNNGRIYVQSDPGEGTTFTIEFLSICDEESLREEEEHSKHQLVD